MNILRLNFLAISILFFASCNKCKECFLVEKTGSSKVESPVGERCGQEIEDLEKHDLVCLSDDCYYTCK